MMEGFFATMTNNINNHHHGPTSVIGHPGAAATNGTSSGGSNNQRISNEKQFKCDFCDKTFTQRRNQRAHIRTVHEKLKPFQCTHCGLTANRKFNLLSHIKKMHGTTEGTAVIDTRLSGSSASVTVASTTTSSSSSSKSKKHHAASNHHQNPLENIHQQCLVCSAPVKIAVNKYFCDKCEPRFTAPASAAAAGGNYLSNVQGKNFNSAAGAASSPAAGAHRPPTQNPQTFRCLQCPFVTQDSSAMIGHHLHAHSSYPMPM